MKPLNLSLENFFSHRDSEIDFKLFNSALLLGSIDGNYSKSNGSGKSAIFEAILWCLFNKSRAYQMDDVVQWGETKCQVTFDFLHDNKTYRVRRTRFSATSTSTVEFSFLNDDDGKWATLSGSTSGDTNEKICSTIKLDYKTFINSVYFRQNDVSEFSLSDASRKKEILKSIVDISKWDNFEKESKKKLKKAQQDLLLVQTSIDSLSSEITTLAPFSLKLKELEAEIVESNLEQKRLQEEVDVLNEAYSNKKSKLDTDKWDSVSLELTNLKDSVVIKENRFDSLKRELNESLKKAGLITSQILEIESQIKLSNIDPDLDTKIDNLKTEISNYSSIITSSKERIRELSKITLVKGECYVCHQGIEDSSWDQINDEHQKKLQFFKHKLENAVSRMKFLDEEKSLLDGQAKLRNEIKKISEELPILKFKRESFDAAIIKSQELKDSAYSELVIIKEKIDENEKIIASLKDEDFKNIMIKLKSRKEGLQKLSENIVSKSIQLGVMREKTSSLESKRNSLNVEMKNLAKKQDKVSVLDKLSKMFGKNGIQTILLNAVISDLEKKSNEILESITEESIQVFLETQRVGSDGVSVVETLDLNVKKDGTVCNFYSLSGGEQFRIAIALRIALSEIASNHGGSLLEFLLLDEVNSPLDKNGVETLFVNVIKVLEAKYKMLIITHDDSLKERFDNIIEIQKINGESSAVFTSR